MAATAGPAVVTPPPPTPDRSPSLAAAALDLAPPAPQADAPRRRPGRRAARPCWPPASPPRPTPRPCWGRRSRRRPRPTPRPTRRRRPARRRVGARRRPGTRPRPKPAPKPAVKQAPKPAAAAPAAGSSVGTRALALAKGKLGAPYVWGAAGPSAFDCSGLIVWAYKQLGVSLPHSSATLSTMGTPVSKAALQPGDLVFFYSPVSHVGIYAGNGMVLNATQSGEPVQLSKLANLPFHNATRLTK